jgi:hypothetical protein
MQVQKVTGAAKRVNDHVMLTVPGRQGIDSDYKEIRNV